MSENVFKLVFKTVMAGSGFEKMDAKTSELMKKMGKMSQGVNILGQAFGNLGGMAGKSIAMLMQGGIWGAAATVATVTIGKAVDKFREWKRAAEDAALAARGMSREYMTLEHAQSGYMKRVESWKRKMEEADKAEKEAIEKRKKAIEGYLETQRKAEAFAVAYAAAESRIAQESLKAGLESDKEIVRLRTKVRLTLDVAKANVKAAEEQIRIKAKHGDEAGTMLAKKDLELAVVQQANAVREARKLVKEYEKAKALKEDETDKAMMRMRLEDEAKRKETERRERLEKAQGEVRKKYAEAVRKIEDEIAKKKEESARFESNASRARGVGFGDWMRGERDRERGERTARSLQDKREAAVDAEIERLETTNPRTRTAWQRSRLAKLKEWKADQDPANNPAEKAVKALQDKRDKLLEDQTRKLEKIAELLKEATTI